MTKDAGYNKGGGKIWAAIRDECERLGAIVGEIGGGGIKAHALIEFGGKTRKVFFPPSPAGSVVRRSRHARHCVKAAIREIMERGDSK